MRRNHIVLFVYLISCFILSSCDNGKEQDNKCFDEAKCSIKSISIGAEKLNLTIKDISNSDNGVVLFFDEGLEEKKYKYYITDIKFSEVFPVVITSKEGERIEILEPKNFDKKYTFEQRFENKMKVNVEINDISDSEVEEFKFRIIVYSADEKLKLDYLLGIISKSKK